MKKQFWCLLLILCLCSVSFAQQGSTEQLAIEFLNNGEIEKALKLFDEAYSKAPSPHIYKLYLDALLQERNTRDAERLVRRHQRNFPQSPTTTVDLGYVFLISGDKTKADKEFSDIINKLPNNHTQIIEIAVALFDRRQTEYAIQAFSKGRQILNSPQAFARDLATLYERANRMADMINEYLVLLDHNPSMLSFVQQRMQVVLANDTEKNASAEIRKTILDYIQKNPQSRIAQDFWISLLLTSEDFDTALTFARAYDRRFGDVGQKVLEVARIAQNSMSKVAEQAYQYLIAKGETSPLYFEARMGLLSYYYQQISTAVIVDVNALLALEKQYEELLNNRPLSIHSVPLFRDWARISAFYKGDFEKADSLLNIALNIRNLPRNLVAEVKLDLADIYLFTGEVWESTLLYSQVEKEFKHDEIGFNAKLRNARLSYYIGEFEWSLAQLDVLRAATSKLIANDAMELSLLIRENNDIDSSFTNLRLFAHADLLIYQRKYDEALLFFDSIRKRQFTHSLYGEIQMRRAEIALKRSEPEEALAYLEDIFVRDFFTNDYAHSGSSLIADDALYLAARICEDQLKLPSKAMSLYERLLIDYPSSLYVPDARRRFRELRGY
ncbi:MAG: tetratricopeptide repeat protein [Bacteroidales bacterium]|jgi:tetratricopeptide (TPR) repeat protein|nr:tetratricopeptide repeat protein [Bacteroidales bacterium]